MADEQRADDVESDRERHGQLHPGTENEGGERTDCDPERPELVAAVMDQFADEGADESADDQSGRRKEYHADDQPYERASGRLFRAAEPTRQPSRQQVVEHRDRERREPPDRQETAVELRRSAPAHQQQRDEAQRRTGQNRQNTARYADQNAQYGQYDQQDAHGFEDLCRRFPAARSGVRSMNRIPFR